MASSKVMKSLCDQIRAKIKMTGPITVAEYMKMALTQPTLSAGLQQNGSAEVEAGYYMSKDVFGVQGDFITSPEISQMFGEMIAIWGLQTWMRIGGPKQFNIVELGPGRGTLASDILRVFKKFEHLTGADVALHLVEISPMLANIQEEKLCGKKKNYMDYLKYRGTDSTWIDPEKVRSDGKPFYHESVHKEANYPIFWYRDIQSLPREFYFLVAHEFFDALPVHKLQKSDDQQWREVLIDIDSGNAEANFRYVLSKNETPTVKILKNLYPNLLQGTRSHLEVSIEAIQVLEELSLRTERDGGMALIVDYGHDGVKEDTFRGFCKHKLHNPLLNPGQADLTADVDFSLIRKLCWDKTWVCGPVNQQQFLRDIGIDVRLEKLLMHCKSDKEIEALKSGYKMLMEDMGERFKVMGLFPKILESYKPVLKIEGFS